MSSFLTVEDVNSCFFNAFDNGSVHLIDTSLIGSDEEYEDVDYDFVKVTHEINGDEHTFSFAVSNLGWSGLYYFLDEDGEYIDSDGDYDDGVLSITTDSANVTCGLYISLFQKTMTDFNVVRLDYVLLNPNPLIGASQNYYLKSLTGASDLGVYVDGRPFSDYDYLGDGIYELHLGVTNGSNGYIRMNLDSQTYGDDFFIPELKKKPSLTWWSPDERNIRPGKINKVRFSTGNTLPLSFEPIFIYNEKELEFRRGAGSIFEVTIDLTDKKDLDDIIVQVTVNEDETYMKTEQKIPLYCKRTTVNDIVSLAYELNEGTPFLELGANLTLTTDLFINSIVNITGNNKILDLDGYSIILNEGATFNLKNTTLKNGDMAIIQKKNTKTTLEKVNFINNTSQTHLGACINCNIDLENINETDDYTTVLQDCTFTNNESCILHSGKLVIHDTEYLNNDITYANQYFPAFLYQSNGEANIRNSIFDIDYDTNTYCEQNKNIGFAQALLHCGESAIINNATLENLKEDNKLPFFEAPYNNRSHVFAKYYYSQIYACVYTSPKLGYEDKSICYSVSEDNWVYKQNVQVTRADANQENTVRRL